MTEIQTEFWDGNEEYIAKLLAASSKAVNMPDSWRIEILSRLCVENNRLKNNIPVIEVKEVTQVNVGTN